MALTVMYVTNADYKYGTSADATADVGKEIPVSENIYQFYAAADAANPSSSHHAVTIVMPLGGVQSGLFRFPRVGERVLVDDASWYMLGYVPLDGDAGQPLDNSLKTNVIDKKAEVFRYKKTGVNTSDSAYSEIGFYSQKAEWPLTKGGADFPMVDQVLINSTGDIKSKAANHHQLKAKRFEVLVGDNISIDHTKIPTKKGEMPLGDNPGDDPQLHTGDAHIRAKNRVIIKAEEEITLQVGRSVLKIDDDGITLKSKITNSNFPNSYDASIEVSPREGVSMNGLSIDMTAVKSFSLEDSFGGEAGSKLGVVSVGGREIKIESMDAVQYGFLLGYAGAQYVQNVTSGGMAAGGSDNVKVAEYMKFAVDIGTSAVKLAKSIYDTHKARVALKKKLEEARAKAATDAVGGFTALPNGTEQEIGGVACVVVNGRWVPKTPAAGSTTAGLGTDAEGIKSGDGKLIYKTTGTPPKLQWVPTKAVDGSVEGGAGLSPDTESGDGKSVWNGTKWVPKTPKEGGDGASGLTENTLSGDKTMKLMKVGTPPKDKLQWVPVKPSDGVSTDIADGTMSGDGSMVVKGGKWVPKTPAIGGRSTGLPDGTESGDGKATLKNGKWVPKTPAIGSSATGGLPNDTESGDGKSILKNGKWVPKTPAIGDTNGGGLASGTESGDGNSVWKNGKWVPKSPAIGGTNGGTLPNGAASGDGLAIWKDGKWLPNTVAEGGTNGGTLPDGTVSYNGNMTWTGGKWVTKAPTTGSAAPNLSPGTKSGDGKKVVDLDNKWASPPATASAGGSAGRLPPGTKSGDGVYVVGADGKWKKA